MRKQRRDTCRAISRLLLLIGFSGLISLPLLSGAAAASSGQLRSGSDPISRGSGQTTSPGKVYKWFPQLDRSGIKEVIPDKFKKRYEGWKNEFLTTETGRSQWAFYAHASHFLLTITISRNNEHRAMTDNYKWDDAGHLIAATITLGSRIDRGAPVPVYYPVTNALAGLKSSYLVSANSLAAGVIAHEFGHVNQVIKTGVVHQSQNQLISVYASILLSNGHDSTAPRLEKLVLQIGGKPVEIWAERECWAEANALLYLRDRLTEQSLQRSLRRRINGNVERYGAKLCEAPDVNRSTATSGNRPTR